MAGDRFHERYGFDRRDVGVHNWRQAPYSRWSFQHIGEVVPVTAIRGGTGPKPPDSCDNALLNETVSYDGTVGTLSHFLSWSTADSFVVSKAGRVLVDWHAPTMDRDNPHLLFSISKSITGLIAGILQDQGVVDPSQTVAHYMPEMTASGYGDCPLQHLLDMRAGINFTEDYTAVSGDYLRYRRATAWNPLQPGEAPEGLEQFLASLGKSDEPHGGVMHYQSPNSDLLGLVLQRASGERFADLMSSLVWQPLEPEHDAVISVDPFGAPRTAGGIYIAPHDLRRLGEMILADGTAGSRRIVSERWIDDMKTAGDPEAWANGDFGYMLPGGRYRNKWYQFGAPSRAVLCIGIHGQFLFIDPERDVVIVKLSSHAHPLDDKVDLAALNVFTQVAAMA